MSIVPSTDFSHQGTRQDLIHLKEALATTLAPVHNPLSANESHQRLLNLACGRADETGVLTDLFRPADQSLEIVGADLRAPEIDEARIRWKSDPDSGLHTRFESGDGIAFLDSMSTGDEFDIAFMRHQNWWNGKELWEGMFDRTLHRLTDDGLLVITSYFDLEHNLACDALRELGARQVSNYKNPNSRRLSDARGKSVDRHIAVFRKPPAD